MRYVLHPRILHISHFPKVHINLFMCNPVHIRCITLNPIEKIQGHNFIHEKRLKSLSRGHQQIKMQPADLHYRLPPV